MILNQNKMSIYVEFLKNIRILLFNYRIILFQNYNTAQHIREGKIP